MERHRLIACAPHEVESLIDGEISAVALLACSKIDGCLGEWYSSLGPSYLVDRIEGGIGKKKGIGIGQADIFGRTNHQSAGNKLRVLASLYHTSKPIEGSIRITSPDTLDECRDDVVMHFAILVVGKGILLQAAHHYIVGNDNITVGGCLYHQFQDIEQFSRIAPTISYHCSSLAEFYMSLAQHHICMYCPVEQLQEVVLVERLQDI